MPIQLYDEAYVRLDHFEIEHADMKDDEKQHEWLDNP